MGGRQGGSGDKEARERVEWAGRGKGEGDRMENEVGGEKDKGERRGEEI